jgi:hypothetical protein
VLSIFLIRLALVVAVIGLTTGLIAAARFIGGAVRSILTARVSRPAAWSTRSDERQPALARWDR